MNFERFVMRFGPPRIMRFHRPSSFFTTAAGDKGHAKARLCKPPLEYVGETLFSCFLRSSVDIAGPRVEPCASIINTNAAAASPPLPHQLLFVVDRKWHFLLSVASRKCCLINAEDHHASRMDGCAVTAVMETLDNAVYCNYRDVGDLKIGVENWLH